jgi:DNA repair protein RecO (recombination protein O)
MSRIELCEAYLLHARAYRESSLLVDVFSSEIGRFRFVARGARRPRARQRSLLQPFVRLLVSVSGKNELKTLTHVEAGGPPWLLPPSQLVSGFYLNELLYRLLVVYDPMPVLFRGYEQCLRQLATSCPTEAALRQFELLLLRELGYALELAVDSQGQALQACAHYGYQVECGFLRQSKGFSGEALIALAAQQWDDPAVLRVAKQLTRLALTALLGTKPLMSRACYFRS